MVAAALAPALVDVASHDTGPAHRPAQHMLERRMLRKHLPLLVREDQLRRRRDRPAVGGEIRLLKSEPLALGPPLHVGRELPRLGFRRGRRRLAEPTAVRIADPQVPGAALLVDRRHG